MISSYFAITILLIIAIVLLIMLSNRLKVAYPVLLVIAGLCIGFIPGLPVLHINPDLIFLIFLPPLLYEAAWNNSWKELWHWRRIIGSFAFVVVFFTALSVALAANWIIPGFTLALGFLLGGIVSPPDAVSAGAILKFVTVPKRMSAILEGESLMNDASSLIILQFAIIAISTGSFVLHEAVLSFIWMVVAGPITGLGIGFIILKVQRWLPTDARMDTVITLITPYLMYLLAEEVHASGVLAVVSGGLFLSYHRYEFLGSTSRVTSENFWQSFIFLLNGFVFMLIGLDLPEIMNGLQTEHINLGQATWYAVLITSVLIIVRLIAAYGALITTILASKFIQVADKNPGFRTPIVLGWTGMRGVVSLAAALSIPLTVASGADFPHRNLILYITFVVIFLTLVVQGLTLPYLIKKVKLPNYDDHDPEEEVTLNLRNRLASESLQFLHENHPEILEDSQFLDQMSLQWHNEKHTSSTDPITEAEKQVYFTILNRQRATLIEINKKNRRIDEDVIRKFLHKLDLEEEKLKLF